MRHFLEIDDVSAAELEEILDASEKTHGPLLAGRGVALLFEKPSLRTRNSAEMAVVQLGGHPAYITDTEIALDRRESVEDVTRTLNGYYDVLAARVFEHRKLERMAAVSDHPVINLLSDSGHPVQTLADLLTIRQCLGTIRAQTIGWIGDFSNVARSLALGAVSLGASFRFAGPPQYGPTDEDLERIRSRAANGAAITVHRRPEEAAAGATVLSTDTWYSMGQEAERDVRTRAMEGCTIDDATFAVAAEVAIFLHCLPAHRGEEVSSSVIDGPRSRVWQQAHNRMHTFRGLLAWLVTKGSERS
jgi:ornithine carbamoyltransferase